MLSPYRDLFRVPGSWRFSGSGFLGRLPMSMLGIGVVLLISRETGQYALAGAVSGTLALSGAAAGPLTGRLIDRFGQARVLRPFLVLFAAGLTWLVIAVKTGAPTWTWFVGAVGAGLLPQFGAMVRARWAYLVAAGDRRQTAFAFESVVDEVVFVAGPPLITLVAVSIDAGFGLLGAVAFALAGGLALAQQQATEPPVGRGPHRRSSLRAVFRPGLVVAVLVMMGTGMIFGSVEVIVVAYAEEQGRPGLAGVVLATWALGSLLAGVTYGAVRWQRPAGTRFLIAAVTLGLSAVLLLTATSLAMLTALMLLSGLAISPVLIGSTSLVDALVPPSALTEGLSWITTGLIVGVTAGAVLSGPVIDSRGAEFAFAVPATAGVASALIALLGSRVLLARTSPSLRLAEQAAATPGTPTRP